MLSCVYAIHVYRMHAHFVHTAQAGKGPSLPDGESSQL
jgi:hypothetical protein